MMEFIPNKRIEKMTIDRIAEYEKKFKQLDIPVPLDIIAEQIFGLTIDWDSLGKGVLGGLNPKEKILFINEDYISLFKEKPGLERFSKAHELGHWDIHVDEAQLSHPCLFGDNEGSDIFLRKETEKGNEVFVIKNAWLDPEIYKKLKTKTDRRDSPVAARQVDRYASFLLMPKHLIDKYINEVNSDIYNWPFLYRMAEAFEVTPTALKIRLMQLGLIYVSEDFNDKKIYSSKEECFGQGKLI